MKRVIFWLSLSGCALLSKSEVVGRRFFTPEQPAVAAVAGPRSLELQLGRVTSGDSLDERMQVRASASEVLSLDDRRWTERPEVYLQRALTRALFERGTWRSVLDGSAPSLEVELVEFASVVGPPAVARVTVVVTVRHERVVSLQQTLSVDRPLSSSAPEAVAQALGKALEALVTTIDELVHRAVQAH
jgi:ABC-type uncharacterized transport system auxiliary subunit